MHHRQHHHIYRSTWHLLVTIFILVLPFGFLLIFTQLAKLSTLDLFISVVLSSLRLLIAFILSAVIGWILAAGFYRGRRSVVALPIFDVLQSFPTFAALPLATLVWGKTNFTVIFFLIITIIWPLFFSIISSLKIAKTEWDEAIEIMDLKGWQYIRYYLWPLSVPGLITGSIIGLGVGWEALVATEIIVGTKPGLGQFFQDYSTNVPITGFGILGFLILIFVINKMLWLPLLDWSHTRMGE